MDRASGFGSLELEASDFGPIVNAKVELRPLTVFVGPSNTGKSYLAMLIYALHQFLSVRQFPVRMNADGSVTIGSLSAEPMSDEAVNAAFDLMRSVEEVSALPAGGQVSLSPDASRALRTGFAERADLLASEIKRCFGIGDASALVRKGRSKSAHVAIRHRVGDGPGPLEHELTVGRDPALDVEIPGGASISVEPGPAMPMGVFDMLRNLPDEARGLPRNLAWQFLVGLVLPEGFGPLGLRAYYLPADRTGLMHAHSVVVSGLIAGAPTAALRQNGRTPSLSGVVADFLEQLLDVDGSVGDSDLGRSMELAILGGSVRIERSPNTSYPHFAYRPDGWREDLMLTNASSMTSEVAPVVLYLRHLVQPGNVLIVEEPESHMHPAMQVKFMRELATIVKAGVRVIVTTHSEWMTEELGNIVRRSALPRDECDEPALDATEVGAWLFEPNRRPKGSVVREILLDDDGQYSCGFDDVAVALHNDWAGITSRIEAGS